MECAGTEKTAAVWEYDSPLGPLTLAEEDGALTGLWMEGQKYFPQNRNARREFSPVLALTADWLDRYFAGKRPEIAELPLNPKGSEFRREVWDILCRIPYGGTATYAAIAAQIAKNRGVPHMSAQAVGNAVGHNPISIIIPCHRVVGSRGQLTGYAGGLERKQWLLDWEKE
ncbi:MAG: methylated-DNA--[protein]-cysteine S-methyltransferase [Faecousia sp.]